MVVYVVKQGQADLGGGWVLLLLLTLFRWSCWVCLHDVCRSKRWSEANRGRLLTSSTTKLSSLLSASLPCERREKVRLDITGLLSDVCRLHVEIYNTHTKSYTTRGVCVCVPFEKKFHKAFFALYQELHIEENIKKSYKYNKYLILIFYCLRWDVSEWMQWTYRCN